MSPRPTVILSPHLDDAVLSCWHVLGGPGDVTVITVFAGSPPSESGASWWDRLTGAKDSAARMEERRAEDREALRVAGRTAVHLDFLDQQYEPVDQSVERIVSRLRELIDTDPVVYAPAALGDHDDHEQVRAAALELAASGQTVHLYADHPHAVRGGWPTWISDTDAGREVVARWDQRLGGLELAGTRPTIHHLDAAEQQQKLRAVSAYRTQIRALGRSFGDIDGFPTFPHEFVWSLS